MCPLSQLGEQTDCESLFTIFPVWISSLLSAGVIGMARPKEAGKYLLNGFSPQQIAAQMGIGFGSVRQYLCMLVGEGTLCRSDLAFSIPERHLIDEAIRKVPTE